MSSIELSFDNPWYLLLAIPAFAVILFPFLRLPAKRRKTFRKIAPVVLHMFIVALLVLIISGFTVVENADEQSVLLLVDLSDSTKTVQAEIEEHTQQLLALIDEKTPVGVIVFGQDQVYSVKFEDSRKLSAAKLHTDATNIDAALAYASTLLPTDRAGHIIVLSDGKQTDGDAITTAQYLATRGIRIDAVYFDTTELSSDEVQINSFFAPEGAYIGDELVFTADIESNTDTQITLSLFDGKKPIAEQTQAVTTGSNVFELRCAAESAGMHSYQLVLKSQVDTLAENNESYAYVDVAGKSAILVIADTVKNGEIVAQLFSADNEVTTVTPWSAPKSIVELCDYDEVILSNVDYKQLPSGFDQLLETYVGTFGRSVLAVGGTNTFMYGNMGGTVLEEMFPVTFTLEEDAEAASVALMLVLDCSSSMIHNATYLSVAKQGAIKCVEAMTGNDYVGVISFNSRAHLQSPLIEATDANKESLTRTISGLSTNRGTYYTEALQKAHEELLKSDAEIRHILFLSDGRPNDWGYAEAVQSASADGITVSTIGLGYSSNILESLAAYGNGRYYYVSKATDLPDIMLSETEQVVVNSMITGEFTPVIAKKSDLTDAVSESALPNIYGYLGTTAKEEATAYITTEEGHPIYAAWTYGIGTFACFTSDLTGDWSRDWIADNAGVAITQQMVATTLSDIHHDSSMNAQIVVRGQSTQVTVTTAGTEESFLNLSSEYAGNATSWVMTQTQPGIFTATIPTADAGVYALMVTQTAADGSIIDYLKTAVAVSYSGEYDAFADSGEPLLNSLCNYTDGALFTDLQALANIQVGAVRNIFNPMALFGVIALLFTLADIAIRKLRWKDIRNYFISRKRK